MARRHLAALAAIVLSALAVGVAEAQTSPAPAGTLKTFSAVDSVEVRGGVVSVRGVLVGESAPSAYYVAFASTPDSAAAAQNADTCQRAALLAMSRPGEYLLAIQQGSYSNGYDNVCRVARAVP